MEYIILLKTESLDNAILAFSSAQPLWYMSYYTMLSIYGRCTRQFKIGSFMAEIFSAKDRMAPEANRFNSFLRILENAISSGK